MNKEIIDLSKFQVAPNHWDTIKLLVAIKSFNLQAIRKRYLASQKRSKTGSVERRNPSLGGIAYLEIKKGNIIRKEMLARLKEPRGIDYKKKLLAISSENKIYVFNIGREKVNTIKHNWFSYIHTVKFNQNCHKLLIASSGVDTIMEFDLEKKKLDWQWLAWEEGFNTGINPQTGKKHVLTRSPQKAKLLEKENINNILITNPQKKNLPTALRAAFINSAEYFDDNKILLTLFHEGKLIQIEKKSKKMTTIISGLNKPHGGMRFSNYYLITDTATGHVIVKNQNKQLNYNFRNLSGKCDIVGDFEWLQTSHSYNDSVITIDSNRNNFTIYNPKIKKINQVFYNKNWAVQDFVILDNINSDELGLVKRFFNKK